MDGEEELLKQGSVKTIMSRNKEKTNGRLPHNGNGAASGGDDLESDSKSGASSKSCTKFRCILALLMGLALITIAVLILIFSSKPSDDNKCPRKNLPFLQLNNKLFATKTLYATTLNHLSRESLFCHENNPLSLAYFAPPTPTPNVNDTPPTKLITPTNYLYNVHSIDKPKMFSTTNSLKSLHEKLTRIGCSLKQFHFFGRHAARYPNLEGIIKINKTIEDVKKRLYAPTLQASFSQADDFDQTMFTTVPVSSNRLADRGNKSHEECDDPMAELKQWNFFAQLGQENLLTVPGGIEASSMAQRFKSIFPEMFDGSKANISFGTTGETRTAQTALHFLRKIDNYASPVADCLLDDFPTEDTMFMQGGDTIRDNRCLKLLIERFIKDKLSLHETCEAYANGHTTELDYKLKLKDPRRVDFIVQSVSKKLRFSKDNDKLTSDEVKAMYDVCRYESALKRNASIWCKYFSDQDLKFYEYLADVQDYFESAYGNVNLAYSACPITSSLYHSMSSYYREEPFDYKPEAHFYFTHSEVLQRLIAASVDLTDDIDYKVSNILNHLESHTVPKTRQWQTSLLTPFSANIAFNLYECPKNNAAPRGGQPITIDLDLGTGRHRVVASINEQPILMTGCDRHVCDFFSGLVSKSHFFKRIPDSGKDTCDQEQYCKTKYVLT